MKNLHILSSISHDWNICSLQKILSNGSWNINIFRTVLRRDIWIHFSSLIIYIFSSLGEISLPWKNTQVIHFKEFNFHSEWHTFCKRVGIERIYILCNFFEMGSVFSPFVILFFVFCRNLFFFQPQVPDESCNILHQKGIKRMHNQPVNPFEITYWIQRKLLKFKIIISRLKWRYMYRVGKFRCLSSTTFKAEG